MDCIYNRLTGGLPVLQTDLWTPRGEEEFTPLLRKVTSSKAVLRDYVQPEVRR